MDFSESIFVCCPHILLFIPFLIIFIVPEFMFNNHCYDNSTVWSSHSFNREPSGAEATFAAVYMNISRLDAGRGQTSYILHTAQHKFYV